MVFEISEGPLFAVPPDRMTSSGQFGFGSLAALDTSRSAMTAFARIAELDYGPH
jgi:hypothetical protein